MQQTRQISLKCEFYVLERSSTMMIISSFNIVIKSFLDHPKQTNRKYSRTSHNEVRVNHFNIHPSPGQDGLLHRAFGKFSSRNGKCGDHLTTSIGFFSWTWRDRFARLDRLNSSATIVWLDTIHVFLLSPQRNTHPYLPLKNFPSQLSTFAYPSSVR